LNVVLTYNIKPENDSSYKELSPVQTNDVTQTEHAIDTFAEWDTWETINALKEAIEVYHDVIMINVCLWYSIRKH